MSFSDRGTCDEWGVVTTPAWQENGPASRLPAWGVIEVNEKHPVGCVGKAGENGKDEFLGGRAASDHGIAARRIPGGGGG